MPNSKMVYDERTRGWFETDEQYEARMKRLDARDKAFREIFLVSDVAQHTEIPVPEWSNG